MAMKRQRFNAGRRASVLAALSGSTRVGQGTGWKTLGNRRSTTSSVPDVRRSFCMLMGAGYAGRPPHPWQPAVMGRTCGVPGGCGPRAPLVQPCPVSVSAHEAPHGVSDLPRKRLFRRIGPSVPGAAPMWIWRAGSTAATRCRRRIPRTRKRPKRSCPATRRCRHVKSPSGRTAWKSGIGLWTAKREGPKTPSDMPQGRFFDRPDARVAQGGRAVD